jgi:translation initiation factor eIF-2B subunit beta
MAAALTKIGIETTLISDAAIYAFMSRVNKVILGTHAVLANGGLIAVSGSHTMAAAAKYHHIPVVVCTGLYKLSPLQNFDDDLFNLCVRPDSILKFQEDTMDVVDVVNPYYDYIAPDLISLFISNMYAFLSRWI